jgi:phage repressor protein C with HTH and peptisase S24 domain
MKSFIEIVDDIKDFLSQEKRDEKVFDKDVAHALGVSQINFATMKKRDKIPFNQLLDFCATRSISINWLLYNQAPESLIEATNQFYTIKYFSDVNASAGGGGDIQSEEHEDIKLPQTFIDLLGGEREINNIEAIRVSGDSMEPTFSYHDVIFINKQKRDLRRGGVFTIRTEHGLFLKRINKRIDGKIDIISDNKEYVTLTLEPNEIELIGRVVGKLGIIS